MLVELLLEAAERAPASATLSDSNRSMSYADLARFADVMRRQTEQATQCERVGIMLPASVAFAGTYFGVLWARRVAVPLNFLLPPNELTAVIADAGIDTIFATKHFEPQLSAVPVKSLYLEDLPLVREVLMARLRKPPPPPKMSADETAVLLYTSGTSGVPKGVMLSFGSLRSNADDCIAAARLDSSHRFLGVLPLFHSFGLTAMLHAPIRACASVHYLPRYSPSGVVTELRERKSSVLMAVASMYTGMLRLKDARPEDFASLTYPISGGEALPMQVFDQFKQRFGIEILQGYGMTETSPVVSLNLPWAHRIGSVGQAIPNVTIAACNDEGQPLATGETGELVVSGSCVMKGYYNKPTESSAVILPDGRLRTGDVGHVDADGFVFITGRKKELIIVGGENVYPREIETVLMDHPAVEEAAVIGQQDPVRGEQIVAFVALKEGATAADTDLREHCRKNLAGYKVPRRVVIRADLPRGPTGKIFKRRLVEFL